MAVIALLISSIMVAVIFFISLKDYGVSWFRIGSEDEDCVDNDELLGCWDLLLVSSHVSSTER